MSPSRLFGKKLTPEERKLALRIATVFAIPMALVMVIPLFVAGYLYNDITNDRISGNRALIQEVDRERVERTQAINDFVYSQCLEAEVRDAVAVTQFHSDIRIAKANFPPGSLLDEWIQVRRDGIVALEPPNESDCDPPPAISPLKGQRP